jgi:hypothetical protein
MGKLLAPSGAYYGEFTTSSPTTGAATDADSTPTATATKNGTDDGSFSLTVTKIDTGRYKVTGTVPSGYASGDQVQISVAATVGSVAGKGVVDQFTVRARSVDDAATSTELAAVSAQIAGIGGGTGAALNFAPDTDNSGGAIKGVSLTGTLTGTYANLLADNGVYLQVADVGNVIEYVLGYSVGVGRTAGLVKNVGYVAGVGDTVTVKAYNFGTTSWDTLKTLTGQAGTSDVATDIALLAGHTGTSGADAGKVYIRYTSASDTTLMLDQVLVQAQNLGTAIGYLEGAVWFDTTGGYAGTTPFVNGVADYPSNSWANALTIAAAVGLKKYKAMPGSSVTLAASFQASVLDGDMYSLALGGRDISGSLIRNCEYLTGTAAASGNEAVIRDSHIGAASLPEVDVYDCAIVGTITLNEATSYFFKGCWGVPLENTPEIDFGSALGATTCVVADWHGILNIANLKTGDVLEIYGDGVITLEASCTGGTVYMGGNMTLTDNSSGVTIHQDARVTEVDTIRDQTDQLVFTDGKVDAALPLVDGMAFEEAMTALLAFVAGKTSGGGTGTVVFKRQDGTTSAITMTVDTNGNRSAVVTDLG